MSNIYTSNKYIELNSTIVGCNVKCVVFNFIELFTIIEWTNATSRICLGFALFKTIFSLQLQTRHTTDGSKFNAV